MTLIQFGHDDANPVGVVRGGASGSRDGGAMSGEELQALIAQQIESAASYVDDELSPARATATAYFHGAEFGNEEEGRSRFVVTAVRDAVLAQLPPLLRIFFGPERVVEFEPTRPDQVEQAAQQTDYIQHIVTQANGGFLETHACLTDGLVRKLGIFKWWWDDSGTTRTARMEAVSAEQIQLLQSDPAFVALTRVEDSQQVAQAPGDALYDVEVTYRVADGVPRFEALPPEEFLFAREARGRRDGALFAHRTDKARGDLIAMGLDPAQIDAASGGGGLSSLRTNPEELARRGSASIGADPVAGEANDRITYVEAYVRVDYDGDGVAELRRICTVGDGYEVVLNDPVDEIPFSWWCPIPEPHTMVGQSWADLTMDLQKAESMVVRGVNDSLALSIYPRTAYQEGEVSVEDILNQAIGAPIRTRARPSDVVQAFTHPFTGAQAMPVIEYLRETGERRTGTSDGVAGLDQDALQSSTKGAVDAAVQAAQGQTELLARLFAEMALKPLFRGLRNLMIRHQPRAKMVRLRGQWVPVDPRTWDADMDVTVNVALGTTLTEKRIATLMGVKEAQELVLQTLTPNNPLVTLGQYAHTLSRLTELGGFKDTTPFFTPLPLDFQPPPPAGPPAETPEHVLAAAQLQIEQMKVEKELAIKQAELTLKQEQQDRDHALALERFAAETELKRAELVARYGSQETMAEFKRELETMRALLDAQSQAHEQALSERQQAHDEHHAAHERQMAEREQALAETEAARQAADQSTTDPESTTEE